MFIHHIQSNFFYSVNYKNLVGMVFKDNGIFLSHPFVWIDRFACTYDLESNIPIGPC